MGIATLQGYFAKFKKTGFGNDTQSCDGFVIVGGSQALIRTYLSLIEQGNGVNGKNDLNQPIIGFDASGVSALDKQRILTSTREQPIEMLVFNPGPRAMGAPTCYSTVEIIKVN